jgi:hypothetical protein
LKILTQTALSSFAFAFVFCLFPLSFCHAICQEGFMPNAWSAKFAKFHASQFMAQRLNNEARVKKTTKITSLKIS